MQESLLLLTCGENHVNENCDTKSASEVDKMGDSGNEDTSTPFQWNEKNYSHHHHQKYPKDSLMLKNLDSEELSGFVRGVNTQSGVYTVQMTEELLKEYLIAKIIVDSPYCNISMQK